MDYQCEDQTSHYAASSNTIEVPLMNLIKELFALTDCDNQDITNVLEKMNAIGIQSLLDELEYEKKSTYKYLSI